MVGRGLLWAEGLHHGGDLLGGEFEHVAFRVADGECGVDLFVAEVLEGGAGGVDPIGGVVFTHEHADADALEFAESGGFFVGWHEAGEHGERGDASGTGGECEAERGAAAVADAGDVEFAVFEGVAAGEFVGEFEECAVGIFEEGDLAASEGGDDDPAGVGELLEVAVEGDGGHVGGLLAGGEGDEDGCGGGERGGLVDAEAEHATGAEEEFFGGGILGEGGGGDGEDEEEGEEEGEEESAECGRDRVGGHG